MLGTYDAINTIRKVQRDNPWEKVFNYLKKLDKDCSFEASNNYMSILVNEKFINFEDHGKQELLFFYQRTFFSHWCTQVHSNRSSRGESRTATTSKMEHFVIIVNGWKLNSDNNHVSQVLRKTADNSLALYERMISCQ